MDEQAEQGEKSGIEIAQEKHEAIQQAGFVGTFPGLDGTIPAPGENHDQSAPDEQVMAEAVAAEEAAAAEGGSDGDLPGDVLADTVLAPPPGEGEEAPSEPQGDPEAVPAPDAPEGEPEAVATTSDGSPAFPEGEQAHDPDAPAEAPPAE